MLEARCLALFFTGNSVAIIKALFLFERALRLFPPYGLVVVVVVVELDGSPLAQVVVV